MGDQPQEEEVMSQHYSTITASWKMRSKNPHLSNYHPCMLVVTLLPQSRLIATWQKVVQSKIHSMSLNKNNKHFPIFFQSLEMTILSMNCPLSKEVKLSYFITVLHRLWVHSAMASDIVTVLPIPDSNWCKSIGYR